MNVGFLHNDSCLCGPPIAIGVTHSQQEETIHAGRRGKFHPNNKI